MSRFAVAFLLALVLPQAAATGFMGKQPQKEVDPAAATAEVVTEEPVIKVEAAPEQPEDQVYNLAADAAEAQDTDDVEEDAVDDDEEGEAGVDTAEQDKTMSGASIDEVVSMQQKESTEEVDEATQKMAAELEISEEDEADDVDEDGDEEEEDEASEDEDSEDTSAEDPIDEM
mmetsp:Transcript_107284/g.231000  ORF Transcript_107284/g.231000 Transcript_107284/m.231000 type:complete len:173 (+) Transcript_107284:69-587(+)